jgi:MoaA/NifB/PqqE/SkfB family radical SAM enzyme
MRPTNLVRTALNIVGPPRPFILYHQPTARCDCKCKFCDFWKKQPKEDDVLESPKILSMIRRAHAGGMTFYTAWGGEPLMAEHLPEWLACAKDLGMMTTMCTSGYRLPDRAIEVAPYTDQLLFSIEAIGENHDKIRRTKGLFDRVVDGLAKFKQYGNGQVIVWCNLTRDNMNQVDGLAQFAKEHGVVVEFFPATPYPGYNDDMITTDAERHDLFERIISLKKQGYPVYNTVHSLRMMQSFEPFKCNQCRVAIQVDADGVAWPCEPKYQDGLEPYGHIDDLDFNTFHKSPEYLRAVEKMSSCNVCRLPTVTNISGNLLLQAGRRFSNMLYYRNKSDILSMVTK